jgi:hypothetical protein
LGYGPPAHIASRLFSAAWDHPLRLNRLRVRSQAYGARICLRTALHPCPRTTIAWDELPSCVTTIACLLPVRVPRSPVNQSRRTSHRFGWLASPGSTWARASGYGNINPLSIDYACRPRLRSRLTLGGLAWPRNPWSSGGRVSHPAFATHACILTRVASTAGSLRRFTRHTTLPYPPTHLDDTPKDAAWLTCECHGFGGVLEPR